MSEKIDQINLLIRIYAYESWSRSCRFAIRHNLTASSRRDINNDGIRKVLCESSGSGVKSGFRSRHVQTVGVGNARSNPAAIYTTFTPTLAASRNMPIRYVPPHLCSDLDSRQI
jgi:hypothetical protein